MPPKNQKYDIVVSGDLVYGGTATFTAEGAPEESFFHVQIVQEGNWVADWWTAAWEGGFGYKEPLELHNEPYWTSGAANGTVALVDYSGRPRTIAQETFEVAA